MVGQRALRFLGLDGPSQPLPLSRRAVVVYAVVIVVAALLMLGATLWVLAGGPLGLALPLFVVGAALSSLQVVWAAHRRRAEASGGA
jgi:hypothetical protein